MATQQEREAFLRGWRAAMDEVLSVLATEAGEWAAEEQEASASGEYKLPGSFALEEVRGSFKGRHELLAWVTQIGPAANQHSEAEVAAAIDALLEGRSPDVARTTLGLAQPSEPEPEAAPPA
jgi:hypothetical protein